MEYALDPKKYKYRVVLVETDQPYSYSGNVDVKIEGNSTICFSVYNNPGLYRLLTRSIEKYFS